MRILFVTDKRRTAIDNIYRDIAEKLPHMQPKVIDVHPKRPAPESLELFKHYAQEADLIVYCYWKTAEMLRERFPEFESKPRILTHHNPYNIHEKPWDYNAVVVNNQTIQKELLASRLIPNCINTEKFEPNLDYKYPQSVGMVAARIESKKGILEVAKSCADLGVKFILVGRISDPYYLEQIYEVFAGNGNLFEFYEDAEDEDMQKLFSKMGLLVVNSVDNFESGPNPPLEAMSVGVPVASRLVGHMLDLPKKSFHPLKCDNNDTETLTKEIGKVLGSDKLRKQLREEGFSAVKYRDSRYSSDLYEQLIYEVYFGKPLVSVVIPTCGRAKNLPEIVGAIESQSHNACEVIIVDDNPQGDEEAIKTRQVVETMQKEGKAPIKYIACHTDGYGLAKARNLGAIAASGQYLLFLDDRLAPAKEAVERFVDNHRPLHWQFGIKGGVKKGFVENFSFVAREDFFSFGMFNERIIYYGGLSQETRERFRRYNGYITSNNRAKAEPMHKTSSRHTKKLEIMRAKHLLGRMK